MDRTLTSFIAALRNAEVRISPAETLDAMSALELVGYRDREFLKNTLSLVLPKTPDEKETFSETFDSFFSFDDVTGTALPVEGTEEGEGGGGSGEGGEGQGEGEGSAGGGGGKGRKKKGKFAADEEEEEDLGHGETSEPQSALGKLLMQDSTVELTMRMADAAKAVDLDEIQVFTQKGLYTRKIMEEMGLTELQQEIGAAKQSRRVPDRRMAQELGKRRDALREQVRDYVERQFLLHADATGRRAARGTPAQGEALERGAPQLPADSGSGVPHGEEARRVAFEATQGVQAGSTQRAAHPAPQHGLRRCHLRPALEVG